jgi:hypothetical protein
MNTLTIWACKFVSGTLHTLGGHFEASPRCVKNNGQLSGFVHSENGILREVLSRNCPPQKIYSRLQLVNSASQFVRAVVWKRCEQCQVRGRQRWQAFESFQAFGEAPRGSIRFRIIIHFLLKVRDFNHECRESQCHCRSDDTRCNECLLPAVILLLPNGVNNAENCSNGTNCLNPRSPVRFSQIGCEAADDQINAPKECHQPENYVRISMHHSPHYFEGSVSRSVAINFRENYACPIAFLLLKNLDSASLLALSHLSKCARAAISSPAVLSLLASKKDLAAAMAALVLLNTTSKACNSSKSSLLGAVSTSSPISQIEVILP